MGALSAGSGAQELMPVRDPWGVHSQSLLKVTNSLLHFCKYQEDVNMKKEKKKKKKSPAEQKDVNEEE